MKRAIALIFAAGCAVDPAESVQTDAIGTYCNSPFYIQCYPWYPNGDGPFCSEMCLAFDHVSGYCPEATQSEMDYCEFHPNEPGKCYGTQAHFPHHCVTGLFSLGGVPPVEQ